MLKKEQDELNNYNKLVSSFQNDLIDIEETREKILADKKLAEEEYEREQKEIIKTKRAVNKKEKARNR